MAYATMRDLPADASKEDKEKLKDQIAKHKATKTTVTFSGRRDRGALRVETQKRVSDMHNSFGTCREGKTKFERYERRKVTKGKQKVKGSTIAPDGWYNTSQGADCVYGYDEGKKHKAVTSIGTFKNGINKGLK